MSYASLATASSQSARKTAGRRDGLAGEGEFSVFNLRDTLNSIIVREANFSEFLSALKQCGLHTARP